MKRDHFSLPPLRITKLDEVATDTYRAAPADVARIGFAVAHELAPEAPAVTDLPDEFRPLVRPLPRL